MIKKSQTTYSGREKETVATTLFLTDGRCGNVQQVNMEEV